MTDGGKIIFLAAAASGQDCSYTVTLTLGHLQPGHQGNPGGCLFAMPAHFPACGQCCKRLTALQSIIFT